MVRHTFKLPIVHEILFIHMVSFYLCEKKFFVPLIIIALYSYVLLMLLQ